LFASRFLTVMYFFVSSQKSDSFFSGLDLSADEREQFLALQSEIVSLESDFNRNITDASSSSVQDASSASASSTSSFFYARVSSLRLLPAELRNRVAPNLDAYATAAANVRAQRNGSSGGGGNSGSVLSSARSMFQNMFSSSTAASSSHSQKAGENQMIATPAEESEPDIVPIHTDHAQMLMNQVRISR
jgi:hypothetical protein